MNQADLQEKVMNDVKSYFYHCGIMRVEPVSQVFMDHLQPLFKADRRYHTKEILKRIGNSEISSWEEEDYAYLVDQIIKPGK